MKKGIIVLLITVLAAGMVFAGTLTGSAGISFGFDLDKKDWGFTNTTSTKYTFKFELDTTEAGKADHETNIWAEIAAKASAEMNEKGFKLTAASISKADIHIDEVTIGILNAGGAYDYAKHFDVDDDGNPIQDTLKMAGKVAPGFTVSYSDWKGGFGATGNTEDETYTVFAHVQTPTFKFVEGLETQAAAYAVIKDNDGSYFGGAVKASYATDKLAVGAAADLQYAAEKFNYEANAYVGYAFVTAYAYVAPKGEEDTQLDAKVAAAYTFEFDGGVTVAAAGYAGIYDAIVDARLFKIGAEAKATVNPVEVSLGAEFAFNEDTSELAIAAGVTYTHEVFVASASLAMGFDFKADEALVALQPTLSISSAKIVENATLALTWKGADFAKNAKDEVTAKGAITASATIAF